MKAFNLSENVMEPMTLFEMQIAGHSSSSLDRLMIRPVTFRHKIKLLLYSHPDPSP